MNYRRAFIQIPILIAAIVLALGLAGSGYFLSRQYKNIQNEIVKIQGERARMQEEKLDAPQLSAEAPRTESPTTIPTINIAKHTEQPIPLIEDTTLKIAKCKAETKIQIDNVVNLLLSKYQTIFQQRLSTAHAAWVAARTEQLDCISEPRPDLYGMSPAEQNSIRNACAAAKQPTVDYYANLEKQIAIDWETAKQGARSKGEESYNSIYLDCLNK